MNRVVLSFVAAACMGLAPLARPANGAAGPAAAVPAVPSAMPTVEQLIARNATARGGADAWRKIQTMAWTGHIESGPGGIARTPFLMMFKRPLATRFEVLTQGQHSIRVFDGSGGWKLRPQTTGLPDLKDYSAEEISYARDAVALDGPLLDHQAKGVSVTMEGIDPVEGHPAYHLKLKLPSGQIHDDWIDAQSFLELRYDRPNRNVAGVKGVVSVYYRNYQTINGLTLPLLVETGVGTSPYTDKMVIEKIAFNPTFDATQFARPFVPHRGHNGVVVNAAAPESGATSKPQ